MDTIAPIPHGSGKILTETITLPVATSQRPRVFRPAYGRFYADGLTLVADSKTLVRGTDYKLIYMDTTSVVAEGKEVCLFVQVLDATLTTVTLTYRPFGGNAVPNDGTLGDNVKAVDPANLKTNWSKINGKPTQYPPSQHTHQWYDLYQVDDFIKGMKSIVEGIKGKRIPYYQSSIDIMKQKLASRVQDIETVRNALDAHAANTNNPHGVTATQLGYGNLPHLPPTSTSTLSTDRQHLLLVRHAKSYIYDVKRADIFAHIARKDNPHQVSAGQVDTYTTTETNSIADRYVGNTETIDNASTLNWKSLDTLHDEITRAMRVDVITDGVFNPDLVGSGGASDTKVLRGDGQYVELNDIFDQYTTKGNRWSTYSFPWQSEYSLSDSLSIIAEAYKDRNEWPVGTVVFFSNAVRIWSDTQRLGKALRVIDQVRAAVLLSSGWTII